MFSRHQVSVGISVDGPKAQHDANRIDRRGRGTFNSMVPKIAAVKQASSEGRIPGFGSLCVVSPDSDARATYMCLTQELGFSQMQFLLPDETHDSINPEHVGRFRKFAEDLFECWENDERKDIRVKLFDETLQDILQDKVGAADRGRATSTVERVVFTMSSAGDIGHDDTLRNAVPELFSSGMNVAGATFPEFLAWHVMVSGILTPQRAPAACGSCTWNTICAHVTSADPPLHRMRNGSADQPSIYCEALKTVYLNSAKYLAKRGVPIREISKNLNLANSAS